MDVQIPELDGVDITRTIQAMNEDLPITHVPIIVMTSHALRSTQPAPIEPVTFNETALIDRLMGDREIARIIANGFLEDIPKQLDILYHQLDCCDHAWAGAWLRRRQISSSTCCLWCLCGNSSLRFPLSYALGLRRQAAGSHYAHRRRLRLTNVACAMSIISPGRVVLSRSCNG